MNKKRYLYPIATVSIILVLINLLINLYQLPDFILPKPIDFIKYYINFLSSKDMWVNLLVTFKEIFMGTVFGVLIGSLLGYIICRNRIIDNLLMPILLIFQIAPKISLAPLLILWFGLGMESKIVLIALVVSFPIINNVYTSLHSIDNSFYDLVNILKANSFQKFTIIEYPIISFGVISAFKTAITNALTAAVIGEMMGSKVGLGYLITYGNEMQDIYIILSSLLTISILGYIFFICAEYIEKRTSIY